MSSSIGQFWQKYRISVLVLAVVSLVAYGSSAFTPSLLGDEWGILNGHISVQGIACPDWPTPRPFGHCLLWFVHGVVGLNIYAYHAVAIIASFLSATLLLILLEQLLPSWVTFNSAVATLFLVYPADMTRTWLAGNIVYAVALYLAAACFLAAFWRYGRWMTWIAGMAILLLAVGTYEVPLGVTIAMSVGTFVWAKHRSVSHKLALLTPALVAVLFSAWRWLWQLSVGTAYGYSVEYISFSPAILISRLIYGYRVNLQWGWTSAVLSLLPPIEVSAKLAQILAILTLAGVILLPALLVSFFTRTQSVAIQTTAHNPEAYNRIRGVVKIAAVGLAALGAGYLPGILGFFPGMEYPASRTHHLPSIGAAIFICAIFFGLASLLTSDPRRSKQVALAGLVPLMLLGTASQLSVQQQVHRAWVDQKQIWQSLFGLAPDIAEGTQVVLVLTGYEQETRGPGPFISGPWGMSGALTTLYGANVLHGYFAYGSPDEVLAVRQDKLIVSYFGEKEFPVAEAIVFVFDGARKQLVHLKALETGGRLIPLGPDRILDTPTQSTDYRWLVQDQGCFLGLKEPSEMSQ